MSNKNFMAYGDAETVLTGVVNWADEKFSEGNVKNNGSSLTKRNTTNFTDFDISDDSDNEETDIKAHRLTSAELTDIVSPLPGTPITLPILFDETGAETQVGWYKLANGTKKPMYQKSFVVTNTSKDQTIQLSATLNTSFCKMIYAFGYEHAGTSGNTNAIALPFAKFSVDAAVNVFQSSTALSLNISAVNIGCEFYVTVLYTKVADTPS